MTGIQEGEISRKFWYLQNSQQQRPIDAEENYDERKRSEISSEWNKFCEDFVAKEIGDLTLRIYAEGNNGGRINCDYWTFPFKVEIWGDFGEASFAWAVFKRGLSTIPSSAIPFIGKVNFLGAEFGEGVSFQNIVLSEATFEFSKFFGVVLFRSVAFESYVSFLGCRFENCRVFFENSKFTKEISFDSVNIAKKVSFCFRASRFLDKFHFYNVLNEDVDMSEITEINLRGSEFEKTTLFQQEFSSSIKYARVRNLMLEATIFREPLVIQFQSLESCPDFSESYLLDTKKLSLNEKSWERNGEIDQQKITKDEEAKFRFLKKYFADQGNHFKEQQYFSYEMMAREKKLRSQVFSWTGFMNWIKNLSKSSFASWPRNFFELLLFFLYKLTSNFGMSWARPFFWLLVSSRLMAIKLNQLPLNKFFQFTENFTIWFPEAFVKTLLPISTAKFFTDACPYDWAGNGLCIINAILIFLLLLGLRNKFKIK